ncbi:MAG: hypothetical protein WC795_00030 [Candidatus Paceibacterota bacterium]|jgi:hypothetical protein
MKLLLKIDPSVGGTMIAIIIIAVLVFICLGNFFLTPSTREPKKKKVRYKKIKRGLIYYIHEICRIEGTQDEYLIKGYNKENKPDFSKRKKAGVEKYDKFIFKGNLVEKIIPKAFYLCIPDLMGKDLTLERRGTSLEELSFPNNQKETR